MFLFSIKTLDYSLVCIYILVVLWRSVGKLNEP